MKSSFNILTTLYKHLNVTTITDVISGEIYKGVVSVKSQKEDVEINVLANGNEYLQSGFVNVNFYCKQLKENTPDTKKLESVTALLVGLLDEKQIDEINFYVDGQTGPIKEREIGRDGMYYSNIKLKFNTL